MRVVIILISLLAFLGVVSPVEAQIRVEANQGSTPSVHVEREPQPVTPVHTSVGSAPQEAGHAATLVVPAVPTVTLVPRAVILPTATPTLTPTPTETPIPSPTPVPSKPPVQEASLFSSIFSFLVTFINALPRP